MRNTHDIASAIGILLRRNAVGKGEVRVRQSTLERTYEKGSEVIVFQNTNGDWFKIVIDHAIGPKG